ncbi:B3 domain-containing protein At5g60140-like [Lycium barbarum]|uniref:B3 domain-containing protein At5g60140-like n=1 Tax=Lycium barbarum TaxID=112863 RepID=UPI00293EA51D|nr:B3 domain-containing protein At5g60140-like [Lycium barbarum]XP_060181786.1 B3 domain-containing protein At5g60140-like [Lycium barbarum]XP_060181787.1 B3 domain-containing protein At5g60140-like [Lycium barbarum]
MEKGFFKFFSPENSSKRLKIPTAFTDYKNGELPRKVSVRDRFGNTWPMGVAKTGGNYYFHYGWEKFIEQNTVEFGDLLIFDYDGNGVFDFKLLGHTCCEKKGAGGLKEEDKETEDEEEDETERVPCSKCIHVEEEDDDEEEEYEEETEEEEEEEEEEKEEENARAGIFKKKVPPSKAGCKRATVCKVRDFHDQYGADIFKSGRATQPKNPYFVAKIRLKRRDQLYVPIDVVRDFKLEIPPTMTICDSASREFETKLKNWKDGRIWLHGGWRSLCRLNLVEKNDRCICEFVKGKGEKGLYLQVQVLHEGASSQPQQEV